MRRFHPFALGSVVASLIVGGVAGTAALNLRAIVVFSLFMAGGAAIASLVCWRWPGLSAPVWKLWPAAIVTNPLFLIGVYWSIDQYDCLLGRTRGWDCMFATFGPILAGLCVLPPVAGLALRWWRARRE